MKYRTIIEIIAEAKDKHEAMDIAGEFLNGGIESGVRMKCRTAPFQPYKLLCAGIFLALVCVLLGTVSLKYFKNSANMFTSAKNICAVQPPLKTSKEAAFRGRWQKEEVKKILAHIQSR